MKLHVLETEKELGQVAADIIAKGLIEAIEEKGEANYLVSTGSSQFSTFEALLANKDIDWTKVTMYHLDEYVALPESHIASFRKYLKERFTSKVPLKRAVFVNGEGDIEENLRMLEEELAAHPIDVGAIGIGEIGFRGVTQSAETEGEKLVCRDGQIRTEGSGRGTAGQSVFIGIANIGRRPRGNIGKGRFIALLVCKRFAFLSENAHQHGNGLCAGDRAVQLIDRLIPFGHSGTLE